MKAGGLQRGLGPLLLPLLMLGRAAGQESPAFAWRSTLSEGLERARGQKRPVLLYFPPVRESEEPAVLGQAPRLLGNARVEGVRVGAGEVVELRQRFEVKQVPACLLLDRRQNVLHRWAGRIPTGFWKEVDLLARRLERKEAEDSKTLLEGRQLALRGDLDGAFALVAPLLRSERTAPECLAAASEIEAQYLTACWRLIFGQLAQEGLAADDSLRRELEALRSRFSHPRLREALEKEIDRLRTARVGGREKGGGG